MILPKAVLGMDHVIFPADPTACRSMGVLNCLEARVVRLIKK